MSGLEVESRRQQHQTKSTGSEVTVQGLTTAGKKAGKGGVTDLSPLKKKEFDFRQVTTSCAVKRARGWTVGVHY